MSPTVEDRVWLAWAAALAVTAIVFSAWPGIDLWASGLFAHPQDGFRLAHWGPGDLLRRLLWASSIAVVLVSACALALSAATGGRTPWLPERIWTFILALYLLGPGVLVNLGLKAHWGRARPDTVHAFGGVREFTAALTPASECARNCSFVSGEAAAATALAIGLAVVLGHLKPRMRAATFRRGMWLAAAIVTIGGLLRLAAGRHFLSDVCFAILFVTGIALVLDRHLLRPLPTRSRLSSIVLTTPATPRIRPPT